MYKINFLIIFTFLFLFWNKAACAQINSESFKDSIYKHIYNNPDKIINLSHKLLLQARVKDSTDYILLCHNALATAHEVKNNIDSTLIYYYKNLNLSTKPFDIVQYKYSIGKIYEKEYSYEDALDHYNKALLVAKKAKMESTINTLKIAIATIKNKIGRPKEAISILLDIYNKQKQENSDNLKFTRKRIIENYILNKETDTALKFVNEGLIDAETNKNYEFLSILNRLKATAYVDQKKYYEARTAIDKAVENAMKLNNDEFIKQSKFVLAQIEYKTERPNESILLLKEILANPDESKPDELTNYYQLLAQAYNRVDSASLSNIYYQKHIAEKEKVSKKRLSALERIHNIEINEKVLEKEALEKGKTQWILVSFCLLILAFLLLAFFRNQKAKNQKRFDNLMLKINAFEERKIEESKLTEDKKATKELTIEEELVSIPENKKAIEEEVNKKEHQEEEVEATYTIDDKKVEEILMKIQKLEEKNYFLRQDCTMHNMAKKLKTNTSYLSKIINTHLDKSFSTYINELRINYAILELKNNKRMRSYSVKGIAEEMGYKNADAFSRYFRAATGITPSVYIKKIQEIQQL